MKLVLQRAIGDCGTAALATYLEATYEDVYVEAEKIDKRRRCKSGVYLTDLQKIAKAFGMDLTVRRPPLPEDEDGLLCVAWQKSSRHYVPPFTQHLVALKQGVVADPAEGLILPLEEYLAREKGRVIALLMETS